jgi:hypothetical protein
MKTFIQIARLTRSLTLAVVAVALAGCATAGRSADTPRPQPAPLARFDLPSYVVASNGRLVNDGEKLAGRIGRGTYDVDIGPTDAKGRGPTGEIDVQIRPTAQGYDVNGIWNGGPISLRVDQNGIHGFASRQPDFEDGSVESCHYDVVKLRGRPAFTVYEHCAGLPDRRPLRFDLGRQSSADLRDRDTGLLLIAYLLAPPTRN